MQRSGRVTDFSRRQALNSMYLDAAKTPLPHASFDHEPYAAAIAFAMNESESDQLFGMARNDPGDFSIGPGVIAVESRDNHRLVDPGRPRSSEVRLDWRIRACGCA